MNNIKSKKNIIIAIAILVVIVIFIVIMFNKEKYENMPTEEGTPEENTELYNIDSTVIRVENRNNYYIVENCLRKFYTYIEKDFVENGDKNYVSEFIYNLLAPEYIKYKDITQDNVLEKINTVEYTNITINDMYVSQRSFDISVYFVYGNMKYDNELLPFSIMVSVDRTNNTFKVYMEDYVNEKYPNIETGKEINILIENNIENNTYNIYEYKNISDETYTRSLFSQIKYYIMNDNKYLYSLLEQNYKANFSSYQEFYDYISSKYLDLIKMTYGIYYKNKDKNGVTIYSLFDKDDTICIKIYENNPFKYTISFEEI